MDKFNGFLFGKCYKSKMRSFIENVGIEMKVFQILFSFSGMVKVVKTFIHTENFIEYLQLYKTC